MAVNWWDDHYRQGGNSGLGSYGLLAEFKAGVLNALIDREEVETAVEFGCGDGNQLSLVRYPQYVGVDISEQAIRLCRRRFGEDPTKTFLLLDEWTGGTFDLALSLDVIYHLTKDGAYERHMETLFGSAPLVAIFSTNSEEELMPHQMRHRRFTDWTAEHVPEWEMEHVANPYPHLSLADFYIFRA